MNVVSNACIHPMKDAKNHLVCTGVELHGWLTVDVVTGLPTSGGSKSSNTKHKRVMSKMTNLFVDPGLQVHHT